MKKIDKTIIWFFVAFIFVWGSWIFLGWYNIDWNDLERYGQFGDSFNVLGVLFNGLALSFLVWTAVMQRKELSETKSALEKQANIQDTQLRLSKLPWISTHSAWFKKHPAGTEMIIRLKVDQAPAMAVSDLKLSTVETTVIAKPRVKRNYNNEFIIFEGWDSIDSKGFSTGIFNFLDVLGNRYEMDFSVRIAEIESDITTKYHLDLSEPKLIHSSMI